jgi:hypothetical protein
MASKGHKRLLASGCVLLSKGLALYGLDAITTATEIVAGGVGTLGLGHAVREKTVADKKLISLSAACAMVLAVSPFIPAVVPFVPLIQNVAAILAALGIGNEVAKKVKK